VMTPIFDPAPLAESWVEEQLANVEARPEILVNLALVATGDPCGELALAAQRIRAPTLVIHGEADRLIPVAHSRSLYERIARAARAEYHALRDTGHMLHISHPEQISQLVLDWRERLH
jgi:pimeloyl-ACP methyl ester carboxylesterase